LTNKSKFAILLSEREVEKMNYKGFVVDDNKIEKIVDKLGVSMIEAADMYLTDNGYITNNEADEMTAKAKANHITSTIHNAKSGKKSQKQRVKKENPLKKEIIDAIRYYFSDKNNLNFTIDSLIVRNDEKYIDFTSNNRDFTINLVEHRKKKGN